MLFPIFNIIHKRWWYIHIIFFLDLGYLISTEMHFVEIFNLVKCVWALDEVIVCYIFLCFFFLYLKTLVLRINVFNIVFNCLLAFVLASGLQNCLVFIFFRTCLLLNWFICIYLIEINQFKPKKEIINNSLNVKWLNSLFI